MLRIAVSVKRLVACGLLAFLAGCASSLDDPASSTPAVPGGSSTTTELQGEFFLAGHVSAGDQSQYIAEGARTFMVPAGTTSLKVTLSWNSPINAEYEMRLGNDGTFVGSETVGASPLVVEVAEDVPAGEMMIVVRPPGAAGTSPYQAFTWEASIVHPAG